MRSRACTIVVSTIALVAMAHPAFGWSVTHRDPDDFEIAPDVHSTTKRVFRTGDPGWRLRIEVRGELGPDYRLRVFLDTRGGPGADFVMVTMVRDLSMISCDVHELTGPPIAARCDADPFLAWWGVARSDLDRDKRIRWRIVASGGAGLTGVTDRAPDTGWYR